MKKILYIDPVDKGYRNFLRFDSQLKDRGIETLLLHTSSFFYQIDEKEKIIENLLLRDISFYNTKLISKVIKQYAPDLILVLNLSFVFDRAVVNIAKKNKIKIIYLSHGSLVDAVNFITYKKELDDTIKKNPNRIFSKKNFFSLLNYLDSQDGSKLISFVRLMVGIYKEPSRYLTFAQFDKELNVDKLLVYSANDKRHLCQNMGFPEKKVKIIGFPEISFFINEELLSKGDFLSSIDLPADIYYAAYLDDGLAGDIWTNDEWYTHLEDINMSLERKKIHLIVKLHPRNDIDKHSEFRNRNKNITFIQDVKFKSYLIHSDFVINHYSSTAIYALLFHKKILVPNWGDSKRLYKKYPENIVQYCNSIQEFIDNTEDNVSSKQIEEMDKYLEKEGIDKSINSIQLLIQEFTEVD